MAPSELVIAAVPTLFFLGLVSALIPRWLSKSSQSPDVIIQLGTCLAAGVFLSGGFLHLLPDAIADENPLNETFPFVYLAALIGYVVVFLLDFIAHAMAEHSMRTHEYYDVDTSCDATPCVDEKQPLLASSRQCNKPSVNKDNCVSKPSSPESSRRLVLLVSLATVLPLWYCTHP